MDENVKDEHAIEFEFCLRDTEAGERLDVLLTNFLKESFSTEEGVALQHERLPTRSRVARWITEGFVFVDFKPVTKASFKPSPGSQVKVSVPSSTSVSLRGDPDVEIDLCYEDRDVLVVNKQSGLVVHPGAGQEEGTLVQGLLHYLGPTFLQVGSPLRPGIVHRLDKDTSGLMVVAKSDRSYHHLVKQFLPPRSISREYIALTLKIPGEKSSSDAVSGFGEEYPKGVIDLPIGRHPVQRKKMAALSAGGKDARTAWEVKEFLKHGCLLKLVLSTGRTHQIRVHLQTMNAPIVGDPLYGPSLNGLPSSLRGPVKKLGRQALHASRLSFTHPVSQEQMTFESPLADDMAELVEKFRTS